MQTSIFVVQDVYSVAYWAELLYIAAFTQPYIILHLE